MRTFKKSSLPDSIEYNGKILKVDIENTADCTLNGKSKAIRAQDLKQEGKTVCLVEVQLHKNLRGRTDLHGLPYKPSKWIYTA